MVKANKTAKKNIRKMLANNKGSAMITALVVGIIVFAFCLSMLLVAYTLFAQANRNQVQLGCKTVAWSTSEELKAEMNDPGSELSSFLINKLAEFDAAEAGGSNPVDRKVELTLDAGSALGGYDVIVTFEVNGKNKIETYVACYKDYGNFRDVQSYTVHRTLEVAE